MFTTKLLATLGVAGALLLGATASASANPWRGPFHHVPVYRPAPVYRVPVYRVPVYRPAPVVYRPAPVVYVPPAPVYVPPAPVYVPPAYYAPAPVVYRAPVYRPWVHYGRW